MSQQSLIQKIRRNANWGLYGSIALVLLVVVFHFCPWHISYQSQQVSKWMLISGTILAVLAVVMSLMTIRKTAPRLRQLDDLDAKLQGYTSYITSLYRSSLAIVAIESVLILLILLLFLAYPNMYKMKADLGLTDDQMQSLFGDDYRPDTPASQE